jgi:single-strand DNA-binding protein
MPNLNQVFLVGRLTRDPELRHTASGTSVANFTLAINRRYRDPSGELKEEASFINVVVWQKLAELCGEHLTKGSPALVEGRLTSRSWETQEGQKMNVVEVRARRVQFLARPASRSPEMESREEPEVESREEPEVEGPTTEDDVPF